MSKNNDHVQDCIRDRKQAIHKNTVSDIVRLGERKMCTDRLRLKSIKQPAGSAFLFCLLALSLPSDGLAQVPFYKGKTITILNGNEPGGTADRRSKAMVPFLRKYIPGEPNILVQFMPGGGGRKVANHIYRGVPRDGLTIGFPPGGFVSLAILGEPGVQYDLEKLRFLGTPESATQYIFFTRKEAGIDTLKE